MHTHTYICKHTHTYTRNMCVHTNRHTHAQTHTREYETGSSWHVQINQKAWRKKCVFRLALKVVREGEALRSVGSEFLTVGAV